jgi:hypothetical protein
MATRITGNKGVWFRFDEKDPESGEICLRTMDQMTAIEITKKIKKSKEVMRNGKRETEVERDISELNRLTYDHQIVDWKGLEDEAGEPIPCTTENKVLYMTTNNRFRQFVESCVASIDTDFDLARERIEKN